MTKEITKANILQELQDKLKLREFESSPFLFSETVIPVYSIDQHLKKWVTDLKQNEITEIGGVAFFTVPDTERWYVNGYNVVFVTGSYTVSGVYLTRAVKGAAYFLYLELSATQSVSYAENLPKTLQLNPGDILNINIDSFTSPGNLRLYLDYMVEEIR